MQFVECNHISICCRFMVNGLFTYFQLRIERVSFARAYLPFTCRALFEENLKPDSVDHELEMLLWYSRAHHQHNLVLLFHPSNVNGTYTFGWWCWARFVWMLFKLNERKDERNWLSAHNTSKSGVKFVFEYDGESDLFWVDPANCFSRFRLFIA